MRTLDLTPLFRSSVGFDHLASLVDTAMQTDKNYGGYPPYNIELCSEDKYKITMAVAGFTDEDISIISESNNLAITGKQKQSDSKNFLHQGIASRNFERKFQLADHVKVVDARLENGLLHLNLERELPEEMKPKKIEISTTQDGKLIENRQKKIA